MDTGNIDNYKFYERYEALCEPQIELSTDNPNMEVLHIWDGYFSDIFKNPTLDGKGWHGFTRDFNQFEGVFGDDEEDVITNIQEYLDDLKNHKDIVFDDEETKEVYDLLCRWFEEALESGCREIYAIMT